MLIEAGHMTDAFRTGALLETRFCCDVYVPYQTVHIGVLFMTAQRCQCLCMRACAVCHNASHFAVIHLIGQGYLCETPPLSR